MTDLEQVHKAGFEVRFCTIPALQSVVWSGKRRNMNTLRDRPHMRMGQPHLFLLSGVRFLKHIKCALHPALPIACSPYDVLTFQLPMQSLVSCCGQAKDLEFISWTRSTRDENGCYTEMSDMEQIGVLMHEWEEASGKQLQGPARDLMEHLRTKNLTAQDAAIHPWFDMSPE